jgi:hypothetical protein
LRARTTRLAPEPPPSSNESLGSYLNIQHS